MNTFKPLAAALGTWTLASVTFSALPAQASSWQTACWNYQNLLSNGNMRKLTCNITFISKDNPQNNYNDSFWLIWDHRKLSEFHLKIFDYPQQRRAKMIDATGKTFWYNWGVDKHYDLIYVSPGKGIIFSFSPPQAVKSTLKANGYGPGGSTVTPANVLSDTPFRF